MDAEKLILRQEEERTSLSSFMFSVKRETSKFHVAPVQRRQRNVHKRGTCKVAVLLFAAFVFVAVADIVA